MKVPVIDVSPLFQSDPGGRRRVEQALFDAHSTIGFSVLVNHGVPGETTSRLFDASRRFHQLPDQQKNALQYGSSLRGFLPLNTSTLNLSTLGAARKPNHSDSFMILDDRDESSPESTSRSVLGGPQIWPQAVDGFEIAARQYRDEMIRLGKHIIPCFSDMMGLPKHRLDRYFAPPTTLLRLLRYPELPQREPDVFGSAPHTDYGCLTFVAQNEVGGLQVQATDGQWFDVPVPENSIVLNAGQVMATWSRDRIRATPHRVINHASKTRYSIAFFFDCGQGTPVAPLTPPCGPDSGSARSPVTYGEHLETILRANYSFAMSPSGRIAPET